MHESASPPEATESAMGELDDAATRAATSTSISSGSTGRELVGAIAASGREVDVNGGGKLGRV